MKHQAKWMMMGVAVLLAIAPRAATAREIAEGSKLNEPLERHGGDDDITGSLDFRSSRGTSRLRLRIKNGPSSAELKILVSGLNHGTFTTSSKGAANVTFQTGPVSGKSRLLDFDPRGQLVEIEDAFDDKLLSNQTDDGGNPTGSSFDERANLTSTGAQPGASGHASLRDRKGRRDFNVEIEDVTDGSYDLIVDNIVRGTISVVAGKGEIEFASNSDDPSKVLLDFDPFGKLIQVAQGSTIVLTGTLLASAPGVNVCTPSETTTVLANVGPDPDASGDARLRIRDDCRHDFRVEVEDLPVGAYDLVVGGTVRGTISVTNQPDASIKGEIEFSSNSDDELPLNFDPAGQTIEVKQGATVFLSAAAGTNTVGSCDVVNVEPDLVSSGADADAKGKARFRQETNCDRDFRVEVEDLPLGNYDLLVGGVVRGTITVQLVSAEAVGEIEFDNEPDQPGELLLNFDPRGQLVEVSQGATLFLSVTMPE